MRRLIERPLDRAAPTCVAARRARCGAAAAASSVPVVSDRAYSRLCRGAAAPRAHSCEGAGSSGFGAPSSSSSFPGSPGSFFFFSSASSSASSGSSGSPGSGLGSGVSWRSNSGKMSGRRLGWGVIHSCGGGGGMVERGGERRERRWVSEAQGRRGRAVLEERRRGQAGVAGCAGRRPSRSTDGAAAACLLPAYVSPAHLRDVDRTPLLLRLRLGVGRDDR
jgi:hypothetical protein